MTRHETGRTTERTVVTRRQLADALTTLGVRPGDVAVVHSSLRAFGFVVGGAQAVYEALREAVGPDGTLVMPAFTPQLCHPATWRAPDLVRTDPAAAAAGMPVFDPLRTPVSRTMGVLPELLRALPGSLRSPHPHVSFVAEGPRAREITRSHPDAYRLSSQSPLGELWRLDATILMLGTGWDKCTALHLAEYAAAYPGRREGLWPLPGPGPAGTRWHEVPELLVWEGDFDRMGTEYEACGGPLARTAVGTAVCRAVPLRPLVDFAAGWLPGHRDLRRGIAPPGWREVVDADGPLPLPPLVCGRGPQLRPEPAPGVPV
ncbi:aminoglycoside N(3)-acetyltransferase [Streptomyces sp. NBC_01205]|uniref:aminoglycoside N(3)-acetyltransferase n=1 Tax=Streptomyces sp. NBC_01205 TaxID=2903771 RepID=UPI002E0D5BF9|nr:AAC(3) family N-acetyltransferase [Streptomyces sp. NBC_01205]